MALAWLTLRDFRNHTATRLDDTRTFNLLIGENGAGKTNVLEAISLLAPGRGLRRAHPADMAGHAGDGSFAIAGELTAGDLALGTLTRPDAPNRRLVRINGADSPAARLGEWLALTWLTPAMDRLFADSAGGRRRFLDRLVLARHPGHASLAARYEAALRERNRLLAEPVEPDPAWLDALEIPLSEAGTALAIARATLVGELAAALSVLPDQPFPRPLLHYASETPAEPAAMALALRQSRPRDRAAGRTLVGPHRDDLVVHLASKQAPAADCSTGEQKGLLIAIVLAHAETVSQPDRPRLLLLDEIAAHLDPLRRRALFERLAAAGAQVWLTGTEAAPFADILDIAAHWVVRDGNTRRQ